MWETPTLHFAEEPRTEEHFLREDDCLLVCDEAGNIPLARKRMGFYHRGARVLSGLRWTLQGFDLRPLASSSEQNFKCSVWLTNSSVLLDDGTLLDARLVAVYRTLVLWEALHESFEIQNCSDRTVTLNLALELNCDYLDMMEIRGLGRRKRGQYLPVEYDAGTARFSYRGVDGVFRCTEVTLQALPDGVKKSDIRFELQEQAAHNPVEQFASRLETETNWEGAYRSSIKPDQVAPPPSHPLGLLAHWQVKLKSHQHWQMTWRAYPWEDQPQAAGRVLFTLASEQANTDYRKWVDSCTRVTTSNDFLNELLARGLRTLKMLTQRTPPAPVPVAGLPWFDAVFGRDSLITGLQTLWVQPEMAVSILTFLAHHQAQQDDPWRDAEPGKIPHEIRVGEMAATGEIPHSCYYGSVDATLLFLILFAETYRWTGPDSRLNSLFPAVEAGIRWIEQSARSPEDGYIRWQCRSPVGIRNQGWKDSRSSLRRPNGEIVEPPVALVEVQAYAYKAYRELSEILRRRNPSLAARLQQWASDLKTNFQRDFWMPEAGYLAQALDSNGEQIPSLTSNAGQVLFCGILDAPLAVRVAQRLMEPDLFTGWGIRTLSRDDPGYNPMSYHNGSVWHHDTALIAAGMKMYGLSREVAVLAKSLFQASLFLGKHPFPELICGFDRSEGLFSVPGDYPASCPVQSWAAGALFQLLGSLLGFRVSDRGKRLHVAPELPDWIKSVELENFFVGQHPLHLYFSRDERGNTLFKILHNPDHVEVTVTS